MSINRKRSYCDGNSNSLSDITKNFQLLLPQTLNNGGEKRIKARDSDCNVGSISVKKLNGQWLQMSFPGVYVRGRDVKQYLEMEHQIPPNGINLMCNKAYVADDDSILSSSKLFMFVQS